MITNAHPRTGLATHWRYGTNVPLYSGQAQHPSTYLGTAARTLFSIVPGHIVKLVPLCTHLAGFTVCPDHAHLILMSLDLNEPPPPEGMDGGWWMVIHHGQAPQWRLTLSDGVRAHFHLHMRYAHAIRHKQDCLLAISKQVQGYSPGSIAPPTTPPTPHSIHPGLPIVRDAAQQHLEWGLPLGWKVGWLAGKAGDDLPLHPTDVKASY
ncbi:hypothetical protein CIB48_g10737, partial [Xylaria polymorpha]